MATSFPPWGVMDLGQDDFIESRFVPNDWNDDPLLWESWRDSVRDVISKFLWPVYSKGGKEWQTPEIEALFLTDFRLLKILRPMLDTPISGAVTSSVLHHEFFDLEDKDSTMFGTGYENYEPAMTLAARRDLIDGMNTGIVDKMGSIDSQLKKVFQRPRAYQVAMLLDQGWFTHHLALSSFTPSLISGHCLSGVMAGCGAFELLSAKYPGMPMEILQQFCVDIGDRRVMAGVHYPSDNLSSWYTALRLIPKVFDKEVVPSIKEFLWGAVRGRSIVFKKIWEDVKDNGDKSPYAAIVKEIETEAGRS